MMIKYQSTILFAFALATSMASDSTQLRGGNRINNEHNDNGDIQQKLQQQRKLMGPNDLACDEYNANDGSIICSFMISPPANHDISVVGGLELDDCLNVFGTDLCLNADIGVNIGVNMASFSGATDPSAIQDFSCEEDTTYGGSIFCTFLIAPPTNAYAHLFLVDCLDVSGIDLCLNMNIGSEPLGGAASFSGNAEPRSATISSPGVSSNPSPQNNPSVTFTTSTEESVVTFENKNPDCPEQDQPPKSGDTCIYSGRYYSCDYFEGGDAVNGARTQCRCNHDGLFYCRGVENNLFN